jgi:hypothetical protein
MPHCCMHSVPRLFVGCHAERTSPGVRSKNLTVHNIYRMTRVLENHFSSKCSIGLKIDFVFGLPIRSMWSDFRQVRF